jgi:acetyl/propionyl-CoA carboxylase alpha subunit
MYLLKKVLIATGARSRAHHPRLPDMASAASPSIPGGQEQPDVQLADERICIGSGSAKNSYLNPDRIIMAALNTGADAIHPGYGFLSENADFARKCAQYGLTFVGPAQRSSSAWQQVQARNP